jgi:hypothetical protein
MCVAPAKELFILRGGGATYVVPPLIHKESGAVRFGHKLRSDFAAARSP